MIWNESGEMEKSWNLLKNWIKSSSVIYFFVRGCCKTEKFIKI